MYSAPLPMMLLLVIGLYLGTYGPGRLGLRLLWLEVGSRPERIGLSCALGAAILGWLGYAAALLASPLLASAVGWAAIALGSGMALRDFWRKDEPCDLTSQTRAGLGLAIILGWAIAAGLSGGQIIHHADGGLAGRFVWPDRLYRNAVLHRLMACSGPPDWPWLAGVPLKGMSLLRYAALVPLFKALGISSLYYQDAACWLGLYGVPIATFTAFAFFRALGASALVSWAVVLTACLGNPRWLLNDRFAHSPALHWAGHDVFAICVPVLFAMLALIAHAIRTQHKGALALAALMLASGLGQEPWMSLAVYPAVLFYCVIMLARREKIHEGLVLALGALVGLAVLKFGMGTSTTARGSLLHALGPSPTIRNLAWAFPFLAEPLRPLLAQPGLMSLLKLAKFASVYAVAVVFYIYGSLWMRLIIVPSAYRFPWPRLREPIWIFGACLVASGILLSSLVNFDKLAYSFAHYDTLRVLWPALLLANLGVAFWLVEKWPLSRRGWGLLGLAVWLYYGTWENVQLVFWARALLPHVVIPANDMAALRWLAEHGRPEEIVFIQPKARPATGHAAGGLAGHNWGYVSGLLPLRVWLDNEDMARKFGQGPLWDARWQRAEQAIRAGPQAFRIFLQQERISWLIAQEAWLACLAKAAGWREAFQQGDVIVFQRSGA